MSYFNVEVSANELVEPFLKVLTIFIDEESIRDIEQYKAFVADAVTKKQISNRTYNYLMYLYLTEGVAHSITVTGEDGKIAFEDSPSNNSPYVYESFDIDQQHHEEETKQAFIDLLQFMGDPTQYLNLDMYK